MRIVAPGLTVREHRGLAGFDVLRQRWQALSAANERMRFHQSFDWYHACARHLSPDPDGIHLFAVERGGRVCAILPLEERQVVIRRHRFRAWCVPDVNRAPTADLVLASGEERAVMLQAIVVHLDARVGGPRLLMLRGVPLEPGEALIEGEVSGRMFSQPVGPCDLIRTTGSYDELLAGLSRNFRGNLRKARNKLAPLREVEFRTDAGARIIEAVQTFIRVEERSWKGAGGAGTAIALEPRVSAFYAGLATAAEGSEVRSLWVDDRCIAAQLCLRSRRELAILKIGYDEDFSRLAPGQLLLEATLKDCCERSDVDEVNLVSDTAWHLDWKPVRRAQGLVYFAFSGLVGAFALALLRSRVRRAGASEDHMSTEAATA